MLALKLALGHGGKLTNQQGAMHTVAHQPFGKVLLTLVAIGLGGYSLWRLVRAAIGHGPEGSDSGIDRVAALASGIVYGGMCLLAVEILLGGRSGGGSSTSPKQATAGVFGWPAGTWLVGIAGAMLIGVASVPGVPRAVPQVPRRLEDRRDEPRDEEVDHAGSERSAIWRERSSSRWSASS